MWEDAVVDVVARCVASLPENAATVEIDRSPDGRSGFSTSIDIRPRNVACAWIGGGVEELGGFNLTVGEIWLERFGSKDDADALEDLRQLLLASFYGRLFQKGHGRTASGWAVRVDGTRLRFGALNGWTRRWATSARAYPPYS